MNINQGLFSSKTDQWATPQNLFDELNRKYHFDIDVCATDENAKCSVYFTEEQDGLKQDWQGKCWCNPPYGRQIGLWMEKAYKSSILGALVVCLVPARTDTKWWNQWAIKGEIKYIKGRLKFGGSKNSAPFPSALVTYRPPSTEYAGIFSNLDHIHEENLWGKDRISVMAPWLLQPINVTKSYRRYKND